MEELKLVPNSHIEDADGTPIAVFVEGTDFKTQQLLANSLGMQSCIDDFVEGVESGKLKQKKSYNSFKKFSSK